MTDLRVDLDELDALARRLRLIQREFMNAEEFSSDVADAVGHKELGTVVTRFGNNWNEKRQKFIENVAKLEAYVTAIHETFRDVDRALASRMKIQES